MGFFQIVAVRKHLFSSEFLNGPSGGYSPYHKLFRDKMTAFYTDGIDTSRQTFDGKSFVRTDYQGLYSCAISAKDFNGLSFFARGAINGGESLSRVRKNVKSRFGGYRWFGIDQKQAAGRI